LIENLEQGKHFKVDSPVSKYDPITDSCGKAHQTPNSIKNTKMFDQLKKCCLIEDSVPWKY